MLLHNVDIYGGIGLFTLMTMYVHCFTLFPHFLILIRYDSYVAKQLYLKGEPDDLGELAYKVNNFV